MKIVHTSDWHAGRVWKGVDRLPELEACLDEIAELVEEERSDLLLMTGDVFDSGAPSAKAERSVFSFFKRVGESGAHIVVIAGNHDSGARLEAWSLLAELINVHAVGRPLGPDDGGVMEIPVRSGEVAVVAAVPFASPRRLVGALDLAEGEAVANEAYADRLAAVIEGLCERFRPDAVNLLCLHTHLEGAVKGASERVVHLSDEWAADPLKLPAQAQYIALGHIHKAQRVHAAAPAYYAGAPLQLDFGEADQRKCFFAVEAKPGQPGVVRRIPHKGGKRLRKVTATLDELEERREELAETGWMKVEVPLEEADPEINRKVRTLLPNAVSVDVRLPKSKVEEKPRPRLETHSASEVFADYYRDRHERDPSAELLKTFEELLDEIEGAPDEAAAATA